jgi:hypothetical protein
MTYLTPEAGAKRAASIAGLIAFLFTWTLTTHGKYSVTGDEPHYMMVTHSLVFDRDLDLANNYARDDGRWFGHDHLQAGPHARIARNGELLSVHDIGLPLLLVPAYIVSQQAAKLPPATFLARVRMPRGLLAYSIVSISILAVITLGLVLLTEGLAAVTTPRRAALLVTIIAISPPVVSHSFLVFPEAPALFLTTLVVWFVTKRQERDDADTLVWLAALLGFLPWAHRKYSFYAVGLLFALLWMTPHVRAALSRTQRWLVPSLFVLPQLAFHAWTYREWGTLAGPQLVDGLPFTFEGWKNGLVGLWFDRQSGLLAYAPFYWIVPASIAMTWRRTWPLLIPVLLLYLPMAAFVEWWGGFSPAARYLVPTIPLLAVPIALAIRSTAMKVIAAVLGVLQLGIDVVVWQHPRMLWPSDAAINPALRSIGAVGQAYERLLPSIRENGVTASALLLIMAIIVICSVLLIRLRRFAATA